jgi:hypothetical protein
VGGARITSITARKRGSDAEKAAYQPVTRRHSPFYAWLDHAAIRELVHGALDLSAGERLVLIKGLVPGLIDDIGEAAFEGFLHEVRVKARLYGDAVAHLREGGAARCAAGRGSIEYVR